MARTLFLHLSVAALAIIAMTTGVASAQMADNAVQVAARVVSFLQPAPSGATIAAIIYRPGDVVSENEARAIEHALGSGLVVGSLLLKPKRVAIGSLDQLTGVQVAFVTRGTDYREIASATAPRSILTISSDPACARAGYCVVAIRLSPRVQIIVSKAASRAAKLRFSSSFIMLIKEI